MSRLPDLVVDSKLESTFHQDARIIIHTASESNHHDVRLIQRTEHWRDEICIGEGYSGSVWLQRCIGGPKLHAFRAVKKVPKPYLNHNAFDYRELEASAKFSHRKVRKVITNIHDDAK